MGNESQYTLFHPKWFRQHVSVWWWLASWRHTRFVLRELTSVAVAYFALILLWKVRSIARGAASYVRFLERMESPIFIALNSVAFIFVLFHSMTWFNLAPKAMVVRLGGRRLPDWAIQAMNYLAWVVVSAVLVWILRRE